MATPDRPIMLPESVGVPPHVFVRLGTTATTRPATRASEKVTPVKSPAAVVFGLVMVNVTVVVPFKGMLGSKKALPILGGAVTVMLAFEVFPVPPSVEVTCTLLFLTPVVVPVTLTEKVQEDPAAGDAVSVPLERLTLPLPDTAVIVPLPQVPVMLGVAETTKPAGRLSIKATPLNATLVFGLLTVKLNVLPALSTIMIGLKDLVMAGADATVRLAVAVLPVPPLVELTAPVVLA